MPPRIPPGRAGRSWLVERLQVARRGAELLDRKRQALLHEQARLRGEADEARRAWNDALAQAELWSARAKILDGAGRLEVLSRHVREQASIELSWSNLMGAHLPSAGPLVIPDPPALSALGAQLRRRARHPRLLPGHPRRRAPRGGGARQPRALGRARPRDPAPARPADALDTPARAALWPSSTSSSMKANANRPRASAG